MNSDIITEANNTEVNGGLAALFKWTKDAIFGSEVSPSRKYIEFAQDDTNYKYQRFNTNYPSNNNESQYQQHEGRSRSSSWTGGLDKAFYDKYDLLQDSMNKTNAFNKSKVRFSPPKYQRDFNKSDNNLDYTMDPERKKNIERLLAPVEIYPNTFQNEKYNENTDTFANKPGSIRNSSVLQDQLNNIDQDPLFLSDLFKRKQKSNIQQSNDAALYSPEKGFLPGKFPSPINSKTNNKRVDIQARTKDHTSDYLSLLDKLDKNSRDLEVMYKDIVERKEQNHKQEESYKMKYQNVKAELNNERIELKKVFDSYYKLHSKYEELKNISNKAIELSYNSPKVDDKLIGQVIDKDKKISNLTDRIVELEIENKRLRDNNELEKVRFLSRIEELEALFENQRKKCDTNINNCYTGNRYKTKQDLSLDDIFLRDLNSPQPKPIQKAYNDSQYNDLKINLEHF